MFKMRHKIKLNHQKVYIYNHNNTHKIKYNQHQLYLYNPNNKKGKFNKKKKKMNIINFYKNKVSLNNKRKYPTIKIKI